MLPPFEFGARLTLDNVLRSTRTGEAGTTVSRVGHDAAFPAPDVPRYAASTELTFDLKGVSRRSLSQILDGLLTVNVRAAPSNGDELLTMVWRGSASDLIRHVELVTD